MTDTYTGPDYRGRTGFLGGSFNPIHLGHLSIAQQVREKLGLLKVILVPNNRSPFKQGDVNMAPPAHRLAMCKLAIKNMRGLEVSDREIKLPPPSYTIDSFREWNAAGTRPLMILGADALAGLPDWHDATELPVLGDFVYVVRKGTEIDPALEARFKKVFGETNAQRILAGRVPIDPIDFSSSEIRARIAEGKEIKRFLRTDVFAYLKEKKLYGWKG
ncbi:MAG TPA: nicotinate (nicotinamide) nucleotide adenylyltransferase [Planctomycetota bacterium]|nr:nicotinate (nicotinamide) nucleotide adenylyltransferase [Planctomycetota bacterium]